jgi:hypothetical protein
MSFSAPPAPPVPAAPAPPAPPPPLMISPASEMLKKRGQQQAAAFAGSLMGGQLQPPSVGSKTLLGQ